MNTLTVENLAKTYKKRKVVDNVSLQLKTSEIIGLLGPNGAGKTTCFYMILGLVSSNGGRILLNDTDITAKPIHVRAKMGMGYLPQEPSVFRKLTVAENILAILETRQELSASDREEQLESLLHEFHIDHIRHIQGISLSGGERRRLEIARTLATQPKFILLDEPFAGVDPISITDIKQIISYLAQKKIGIIITDHNVRDTLDICHMAYIMNNGQLIAQGSANEILSHQEVRKVYLGRDFKM